MPTADQILERAEILRQKLRETHNLRGRDFAQAVGRGNRFLPRAVRQDGRRVARALPLLGNAKLERMVDLDQVGAAQARIKKHLDQVDTADIRRGQWLSLIGSMAVNILVVIALFVAWMIWSGHV